LERCKETLGEEMVKLNRHVEDYWRNKLFNLNSKDKNKFDKKSKFEGEKSRD
jgi:hypothetical protein